MEMEWEELTRTAFLARLNAYAPYSNFRVGAAVLDEQGRIHSGCNVENAAYGATNCAERTALFRAIADGTKKSEFKAMVVVADTTRPITPCGTCRQVMAELCPADMPIRLGNLQGQWLTTTMMELLPYAFASDILQSDVNLE